MFSSNSSNSSNSSSSSDSTQTGLFPAAKKQKSQLSISNLVSMLSANNVQEISDKLNQLLASLNQNPSLFEHSDFSIYIFLILIKENQNNPELVELLKTILSKSQEYDLGYFDCPQENIQVCITMFNHEIDSMLVQPELLVSKTKWLCELISRLCNQMCHKLSYAFNHEPSSTRQLLRESYIYLLDWLVSDEDLQEFFVKDRYQTECFSALIFLYLDSIDLTSDTSIMLRIIELLSATEGISKIEMDAVGAKKIVELLLRCLSPYVRGDVLDHSNAVLCINQWLDKYAAEEGCLQVFYLFCGNALLLKLLKEEVEDYGSSFLRGVVMAIGSLLERYDDGQLADFLKLEGLIACLNRCLKYPCVDVREAAVECLITIMKRNESYILQISDSIDRIDFSDISKGMMVPFLVPLAQVVPDKLVSALDESFGEAFSYLVADVWAKQSVYLLTEFIALLTCFLELSVEKKKIVFEWLEFSFFGLIWFLDTAELTRQFYGDRRSNKNEVESAYLMIVNFIEAVLVYQMERQFPHARQKAISAILFNPIDNGSLAVKNNCVLLAKGIVADIKQFYETHQGAEDQEDLEQHFLCQISRETSERIRFAYCYLHLSLSFCNRQEGIRPTDEEISSENYFLALVPMLELKPISMAVFAFELMEEINFNQAMFENIKQSELINKLLALKKRDPGLLNFVDKVINKISAVCVEHSDIFSSSHTALLSGDASNSEMPVVAAQLQPASSDIEPLFNLGL